MEYRVEYEARSRNGKTLSHGEFILNGALDRDAAYRAAKAHLERQHYGDASFVSYSCINQIDQEIGILDSLVKRVLPIPKEAKV